VDQRAITKTLAVPRLPFVALFNFSPYHTLARAYWARSSAREVAKDPAPRLALLYASKRWLFFLLLERPYSSPVDDISSSPLWSELLPLVSTFCPLEVGRNRFPCRSLRRNWRTEGTIGGQSSEALYIVSDARLYSIIYTYYNIPPFRPLSLRSLNNL